MNRRRRWLTAALIVVGIVCLATAWSQRGITGAIYTEDADAPAAAVEQEPGGQGTAAVDWLAGGLVAFLAAGALALRRRR